MAHGNPQLNRGSPESEKRGFEVGDARAILLVGFGVALVIAAAIIHFAAWEVLKWTHDSEDRTNAVEYPLHRLTASIPTRPPNLTSSPNPSTTSSPGATSKTSAPGNNPSSAPTPSAGPTPTTISPASP